MKTLYIDCGMGAAGDMLTAALLELLPDREEFLRKLKFKLKCGNFVRFAESKCCYCSFCGCVFRQ